MSIEVKQAETIKVGESIKSLFGKGKVVFIRWYENDFQRRGYFVIEHAVLLEAVVITVYKGEAIAVII